MLHLTRPTSRQKEITLVFQRLRMMMSTFMLSQPSEKAKSISLSKCPVFPTSGLQDSLMTLVFASTTSAGTAESAPGGPDAA